MSDTLEIGRRIKALRKELDWSQQKVADIGGTNQPTISRIEKGEQDEVEENTLRLIATAFGVSPAYLRYGSPDERSSNVKHVTDVSRTKIPVISWVQAGEWKEAIDMYQPGDADNWIPLPTTKKHSEQTFALVVEGDSMFNPGDPRFSFPPGVHIYVDPQQRTPSNGDLVVARLSGTDTVTFKQFKVEDGKPYLRPLNPSFPPIFDEFVIIGRVVASYDFREY